MKEQKEVIIDEDIDLSRVFSDNLKLLCLKYDSIFSGNHDDLDDIFFIDKRNRFFFTFTDSFTSIYADMENVTKEERTNTKNDLCFMAPILRAVYVTKSYRNQGLQRQIVESIKTISEETGEPFIAVADPFKIKKSRYENSAREALCKFVLDGHERTRDWKKDVETQCVLFGKYNFKRFVLPEYSYTEPFQHFIYVPETAKDGTKTAVRSIQRANGIEITI